MRFQKSTQEGVFICDAIMETKLNIIHATYKQFNSIHERDI